MRDVRGGRWRDALAQDIRYALRIARRFPAFTSYLPARKAARVDPLLAMRAE